MEINGEELGEQEQIDLELLADAFFENIRKGDCEWGGWGLDPKRPFGNSSLIPDLAEIIGYDRDEVYDSNGDYNEEIELYVCRLYDNLGEYLKKRWLECKPRGV